MNKPAKAAPSNEEKSSPNFMGLFKRRLFLSTGFFSILFAISPIDFKDDMQLNVKPPAAEQETSGKMPPQLRVPVEKAEFGVSLSVDCSVIPKQAGRKFSWTNEAHRPLGLAVNKHGAGSEPYMFIGKTANGSSKELESGWLLSYDKDSERYTMFAFDVQESIPEGDGKSGADAKPVPHIVADPIEVFKVSDIEQKIEYQFGDMLLSIQHEPSDPFRPLHFNLTCTVPGAPQ